MRKIIIIFLILILAGCSKEYIVSEDSFFVMDTYINVKVFDYNENEEILEEVKDLFNYYHRLADRYNAYEDVVNVYSINNMQEEYLEIDSELAFMIEYSLDFYEKTNGLFDIAMGNVIDVWKDHIQNKNYLPDYEYLSSLERNEILIEGNKIYRGVNLDLGAIAKGYAVFKAGEFLEENGFAKYIINAGGQVLVGETYRDDLYKVGVKHPLENENLTILNVENLCVSTSGGYERFFEIEGERFSHIINPKTLFPETHFLSVTVLSKDSTLADVLTTILFLMPIEEGQSFVSNLDVEAIWYLEDGSLVRTEGFSKYE